MCSHLFRLLARLLVRLFFLLSNLFFSLVILFTLDQIYNK